jgi:esterase
MTATLAHDLVAVGEPTRWLYMLHGIYGAGRNWGSVIRRVVKERPDWGAVLVDLRQHGGSRGFDPPHTVHAAAEDVEQLTLALGREPGAVLGHSFGGKVALMHAREHARPGMQVWLIDSTPEAREPDGSAWAMLATLRQLPSSFASRDEGVAALEAQGLARPLAQWMATNLEESADGYRWRIDFDDMEALLRDFFRTDLWDVVESPPPGVEIHVVKAEASSVLEGEALERVRAATSHGRVHLHGVAGGHWVNAENPGEVQRLLGEFL